MTHRLLKTASKLSKSIYVSRLLPANWRVWLRDDRIIQICTGDRAVFETGEWYQPSDEAKVIAGAGHPGIALMLENMEAAGGTH